MHARIYIHVPAVESERPIYFRVAPLQIDLHFATVAIEINIREAAESHGWCQSLNRTTRCICALEPEYMTEQ